ncbi:MAG TPA: arsenate reductase ArsC [Pirellulales bacterium]|nr:arsenate reductase ArsC [Pirellulales bacterium]
MSKPKVLFLCTGNSARSQMGEALLRHKAGDRFEAHSAGLEPKGVNPLTVRVLDEIGIDTSSLRSKGVEEYLGRLPVQYLFVVCNDADQRCPAIWPGVSQRFAWPFEDPAACEGTEAEKLAKFRRVRDQISDKLDAWLEIN